MASTGLNFANITPDNGAVRELSQLIFQEVLGAEKLGKILNVLPKQKNGNKVGMIGEFGMLGKASQGCSPSYGNSVISTSEKTWDIQEWEVAESICYTDLEGTLAQLSMLTKTQIADLTGIEYLAEIIKPRLDLALMKMLMRLAWFGDKQASNIAGGGVITDGISADLFKVTDGLWKRLFSICASNAERLTKIPANEQTTFALQKSKLKETGVATGIMDSIIEDAPLLLRQASNQVIYITQSLKDALDADIRKNNKGSELQWTSIFSGIQESQYNGISLIVIPFWDEMIRSSEKGAEKWNLPHRAIYTVKENLLIGLESENEIAMLDIWFEKKDQKNYILAKDKLGTLIAQDDLIQVAY